MAKKDRRHRIEILANEMVKNELGQLTDNWVVFTKLWASYEPVIGNQYFSAQQLQSGVKVKFESEYRPGINRGMRVRFNGENYDIMDAANLGGLNRDLLLYCKEVVL